MDYIVQGILTATIIGVGLPVIGGFLYYNYFGTTLIEAFRSVFGGLNSNVKIGAMNNIGFLFIWMLLLTSISIANLIFVSYLISYYRTTE
jgi:hypothetical protein